MPQPRDEQTTPVTPAPTLDYATPTVKPPRFAVRDAVLFVIAYAAVHLIALFFCAALASAWAHEFSTREKVANGLLGVLLFPIRQIYPKPNRGAVQLLSIFVLNPVLWGMVWYAMGRFVFRFTAGRRLSR